MNKAERLLAAGALTIAGGLGVEIGKSTSAQTSYTETTITFKGPQNPVLDIPNRNGNSWEVTNQDGASVEIPALSGFTPDASLRMPNNGQLSITEIDPSACSDFQECLNTAHDGEPARAGYMYDQNDFSGSKDFISSRQLPAYSWEVFTGQDMVIPGIGKFDSTQGVANQVVILNVDRTVHAWGVNHPTNDHTETPLQDEHGFTATGRIWNGQANIESTARDLTSHFAGKLLFGDQKPGESGFTGQCDNGETNCQGVRWVVVERLQWGNNPDGSAREEFVLLGQGFTSK